MPGSAARRGRSVWRQARRRPTSSGTVASARLRAARAARCTKTGAQEVLNSISLARSAARPGDDPAEAPAGHQEALREAVHHQETVVGLGDVQEARRTVARRPGKEDA